MRKIVCLLLAIFMALSLVACGDSGDKPSASIPTETIPASYNPNPDATGSEETETPAEPQYGGVVKIIEVNDTNAPFGLPWEALIANYFSVPWSETLVNFTQDGVYEPHLAKDWEIDTEAQTITFTLNEGIEFSDGTPFNAEAVAWNINRWPEDGRGNEDIDHAEAPDEYTVVVYYKAWQNVLFETFASHSYSMISMQSFLDNGKEYVRQNPVGTGPFVLSEWNPGQSIKFTKNENYWQEGKPYLDGVEYYAITDTMTQNAAMQSTGDDGIDLFACSNAEQAYTLISSGVDFDSSHIRGAGTLTLAPNSVDEDSPFYDLKVRQALAYAIDREAICEATGFGITKPAWQLTSEGYAGHLEDDNEYLIKYDPELAKQLLTEAGYPDGFDTTIYAQSMYQNDVVAIQAQLEAVGIRCELEFPESGALSDLYYNGWDGIIVLSFGQVMNTGVSYYIWYHPDCDSYVSVMRPPEYEDMYYEARRSFDIDNELFGALGELVLKNMVFVPLYHRYTISFVRNGLNDSGFGVYSPDTIWAPWNAWWSNPEA